MRWHDLILRLRAVFLPRRTEAELEEEIDSHLEMQIRKHLRAGASADQARELARCDFGGLESTKDQCRDERRITWLSDATRDLQYALRMFRRAPGVSALIVLMLALAIGANVATFSVIDAILLKMLPVKDPGSLFRTVGANGDTGAGSSYRVFQMMQERTRPLADLMAYQSADQQPVSIEHADRQRLTHQTVSGNYFQVLGVQPKVGRLISPQDDGEPGAHPVAVISYRLWKEQFGKNPKVIGAKVRVGGRISGIIGVAPPQFFGVEIGRIVDIWTPVSSMPREYLRNDHLFWLQTMGRLHPGVTIAQAAAPMQAVMNEVMLEDVRQHAPPGTPKSVIDRFLADMRIKGVPAGGGISLLRRQYEQPLTLMIVLAALVLLIASTNAANLMIAKGAARQHELAIRLSLGAGRRRVLKQLVTEGALLGLASAISGFLIAYWTAPVLGRMLTPSRDPAELVFGLDPRLLGFMASITFVTVLFCGILPALRLVRTDMFAALKSGMRLTGDRNGLSKKILVSSQIALSLVLVIGAVLFSRTLINLLSSRVGFDPAEVLVTRVTLPHEGDERTMFPTAWNKLLRNVQAFPGVKEASLTSATLFEGSSQMVGVRTNGAHAAPADPVAAILFVSPGYFKTLRMQLVQGRDFDIRDNRPGAPPVVVVNQAFAHKFFGREAPIGRELTKLADHPLWTQIVGIAADAKFGSLRDAAPPAIYVPYGHVTKWMPPQARPGFAMSLQVRGQQEPSAFAGRLRREAGAQFTIGAVFPQQQFIDDTLIRERLVAGAASLFGVLSLLLAALGLYGVMNYAVVQRRQEISIRMALGAAPSMILSLILRESAAMILAGVLAGLVLAGSGTRLARTLLYGLAPNDPAAFGVAALILLTAAFVAAFIPAYKAAQTDPMITLRNE